MTSAFPIPENLQDLLKDRITVLSESSHPHRIIHNVSLNLKCDEKDVNLTGNLSLGQTIVKNNETWVIFHRYIYKDNGRPEDSNSTLVNLKTGELVELLTTLYYSSISSDTNYLLHVGDDGYGTLTCYVYDITDMRAINLVYAEESDTSQNSVSVDYYFDCHSRFVTKYKYEFLSYDGFTTNNYFAMSDYINQKVYNGAKRENETIEEGVMWRLGVRISNAAATVVREIDRQKVTPFTKGKGIKNYDYPGFAEKVEEKKQQGLEWYVAHNKSSTEYIPLIREWLKQFETPYGTHSKLNEMKEVVTFRTDNFGELEGHITC
jgi:hypothetical protein